MKLICPKCKEENKKSFVTSDGVGGTTLLGWSDYFDEEGLYHSHNPNSNTSFYTCSNGHKFAVSCLDECLNCDYVKDSFKITLIEENKKQ